MSDRSKGRDDPRIMVSSPVHVCLVAAMAIFLSLNVANCEVNIEVNVSDMIQLSFSEVYVMVLSSSDLSINLVVFDLVESYFSVFVLSARNYFTHDKEFLISLSGYLHE